MPPESLLSPYPAICDKFLNETENIVIIVLDRTLHIEDYNQGFARLLRSDSEARGKKISDFLLPESRLALESADNIPVSPLKLNFSSEGSPPLSLTCRFYAADGSVILFGEEPMLTNNELLRKMATLNNELVNMTRDLRRKNDSLAAAREEIHLLSGMLPICAWCKRVRDDEGYWSQIESYLNKHAQTEFSHSICPDCMEQMFSEDNDKD